MAGPQAAATGSFKKTPLVQLVAHLADHSMTGTLVVEHPDGTKSAVYFRNGAPAKAKTAETVVYLGRLLVEQGAIDEVTLNRTLAQMANLNQLHGEILMSEGAIDAKTLLDGLAEQVRRRVAWLCTAPPESVYGYYADQNFLEKWGGKENTPIEPLSAIWAGVKSGVEPPRVEAAIKSVGDRPLRLQRDSQVSRFGLGKSEQAVVDVMRAKPQSYSALVATGLAAEDVLDRLVYALVLTRSLDVGDGKPPVGVKASAVVEVTPSPPSAPSVRRPRPPTRSMGKEPPSSRAPRDPEQAALEREVRERVEVVDKQNLYEILGVERNASSADIHKAFLELAKKWHPDRVGPELAAVRSETTRLFARMSEASQVLSSEEKRAEYDELLKTGTGSADEAEEVQRVLNAVTEFQKAEVLLKRNDLAGAERHAKNAYETDREQPEYMALYAWIESQKPERVSKGSFRDLITLLDKAVDKARNNEKIRIWRAQVNKRAGNDESAFKDFRWVAKNNPKNLDAVRELRLYRMRGNVSDSAPPSVRKSVPPGARKAVPPQGKVGGFLKGLFKKS